MKLEVVVSDHPRTVATAQALISSVPTGMPRFIEVVLAAAGLIVFAPLLTLAALAVYLTSGGPIVFRQQRVGRGGRIFTLYKLRTMGLRNEGPQVTSGNDIRITAVGRLLRKTKIDELPQLWNVLKGNLSLVG